MFRASLRVFLETEAVPREEAWREQRFVEREFWHKAGELGALCPSIPVEYGGSGGDFTFEAVMAEELGYCGITSFQQNIHGTIVA
ncbi:acyl-CoA dehydrogenase family protein, partial [Paracoccus sp. (in: a-proteobacteria)]